MLCAPGRHVGKGPLAAFTPVRLGSGPPHPPPPPPLTRRHAAACRYRDFWVTSNVFLARLYRTPLVTIAAIKGACPAGGCCLSMCCDVRVMTEQVHPFFRPCHRNLQLQYSTLAVHVGPVCCSPAL